MDTNKSRAGRKAKTDTQLQAMEQKLVAIEDYIKDLHASILELSVSMLQNGDSK